MSDTEQLYQSLIMDRTRNPRHAGRPETFDAEAEGDNPMCGDRVHIYLTHENTAVHHESRGCAIMAASADLMADAVAGLTPAQIAARKTAFEAMVNTGVQNPELGDLNALAGVSEYRSRIKCATLPWSALAQAAGAQENQNHD